MSLPFLSGIPPKHAVTVLLPVLSDQRLAAGCSTVGDAMFSNSCAAFVQYVQASRNNYFSRTNAELQTYVNQTPAPTAQCALLYFSVQCPGCTCLTFKHVRPLHLPVLATDACLYLCRCCADATDFLSRVRNSCFVERHISGTCARCPAGWASLCVIYLL